MSQDLGSNKRVAAIVLAAGSSARMGGTNKLFAEIDSVPILMRVVDALCSSRARPIIVVTGHEASEAEELLSGAPIQFVHNPDFASGLSSSLRRGLSALPKDSEAVLICLGDMPRLKATHIDELIDAFDPTLGRAICVPTWRQQRGNPVLWARTFVPEMMQLSGDHGANQLFERHRDVLHYVAMSDAGVLLDVDTPEDLKALGSGLKDR
jgi:molybdenum cofactor cytidylyltransferase